eukprot:4863033-Prymnesium_polylepis.1
MDDARAATDTPLKLETDRRPTAASASTRASVASACARGGESARGDGGRAVGMRAVGREGARWRGVARGGARGRAVDLWARGVRAHTPRPDMGRGMQGRAACGARRGLHEQWGGGSRA